MGATGGICMSKPTPAPWMIAEDGCITVRDGNNYPEVARVYDAPFPEMEVKANARLIAAAPDLLEAIQGLLNALPSATTHPAIKAARAAIAKATVGER